MSVTIETSERSVSDRQGSLPDLLDAFRDVPTGNVCDAIGRFTGAMEFRIKPLDITWRFAGPALTVRPRPVDNLAVYRALQVARPGDVLVIATGGATQTSVLGDIVCRIARARGVASIVTDGLVRDAMGIREVGLPVFARGTSPAAPFKDGPGEVNVPVSCGGVPVAPGDIVVGDEDGVVVVPCARAADAARALAAIREKEARTLAELGAGAAMPSWVEQLLEK